MTSQEPKVQSPQFNVIAVILVGLPFVCVFALLLYALFYVAGYRYRPGRLPIPSLLAVVVGTQLLIAFRDKWSQPSTRVWYAALIAWAVLALAFWARVTNRLPGDL